MLDYEGLLYVEELATEDDNSIKNKLWNLFEAPESGNCARLVSLISVKVLIGRTVHQSAIFWKYGQWIPGMISTFVK